MNKIKDLAVIALTSLFLTSSALAGGFGFGGTLTQTFVTADGSETTTAGAIAGGTATTQSADAQADTILGSGYIEYSFDDAAYSSGGNGWTFGVQMTPGSADVTDTAFSRTDVAEDAAGSGSSGTVTYTPKAEVKDLINYYVEVPLPGAFYGKLGFSQLVVITQEDVDHEGSYGNKTLDGMNYGLGFKGITDNNLVWKAFFEITDFDKLSLTSSTNNTLSANVDTHQAGFALGYRF